MIIKNKNNNYKFRNHKTELFSFVFLESYKKTILNSDSQMKYFCFIIAFYSLNWYDKYGISISCYKKELQILLRFA